MSERRSWNRDMAAVPYNTTVEVRAGRKVFEARLLPEHSMTEDEEACDQWVAALDARPPADWSAGCCWGSNCDGVASTQPSAWRMPPPALATASKEGGE